MGGTVEGSDPGESEVFRTRPDLPYVHPVSYVMGAGNVPKAAGA